MLARHGAQRLFAFALALILGGALGNVIDRVLHGQVTDFVLAERKQTFEGSRVVAVHARDPDVWSIGLVTGSGLLPLTETVSEEMVTVFIPSSPTAFSGYVVVAPLHRH